MAKKDTTPAEPKAPRAAPAQSKFTLPHAVLAVAAAKAQCTVKELRESFQQVLSQHLDSHAAELLDGFYADLEAEIEEKKAVLAARGGSHA